MRIFRHIFTATLGVAMTASLSSCVNNWLDQTPACATKDPYGSKDSHYESELAGYL